MLLTPHALVGGAIGANIESVPLVIILAILSHFILDTIPHFDWGTYHENKDFRLGLKDYLLVAGDIVLLLIFTLILWHNIRNNPNIMIGGFFAILVDLIDNVPFWKDYLRKIKFFAGLHAVHEKIHYRLKFKYWYVGVLTQIAVIILAYSFIK
jgi:hypothetical protein